MFYNLQNYDQPLNFKVNILPNTIENYMCLTFKQPKDKFVKLGLPFVFTNSLIAKNLLDHLVII